MHTLLINPAERSHFWTFEPTLALLGRRAQDVPLGLLTLAALLPESWSVELVDERIRPVSEAAWSRAEVIMIGGLPTQLAGMFQAVREGRRRGKRVVVGGSAAYHRPDDLLAAGADLVVVGEVEAALPELLARLEEGASGLALRDHPVADMHASPLPRLDLIELGEYTQAGIQTTRGCPFLCEFCDVTVMNGRTARTKTPAQVLAELDAYREAGWRGDLFFVDDIYNGHPGRARELTDAVEGWQREHGYPFRFRTQCSVTLARSTDLLEAMVRAGFTDVFLGIESPDPEANARTRKFQNAKGHLAEDVEAIGAAGLSIFGGCIVGLDHAPPGEDDRLLAFLDATRVPVLSLTMLYAPPQTEMWARLVREGREVWPRAGEGGPLLETPFNFDPTRPLTQIAGEYASLHRRFYEPAAYLDRLLAHFERMEPRTEPLPPVPWSRADRRAVAHVFTDRAAAAAGDPAYVKRLRAFLKTHPSRSEQVVAHLLLYEHFRVYGEGIEAAVDEMLAARERDKALAFAKGLVEGGRVAV